jgi:hypothetical protein
MHIKIKNKPRVQYSVHKNTSFFPTQCQKKPIQALSLLLVSYNLSQSRSFQYYDNHTDFQENRPRDDSMFRNDVSDMQMDRYMQTEHRQWKVTVLAPDSMREKLGLSPAVFTEEFTVSSGSGVTWDFFRGSFRQNHVPWGRLSLWKWVPGISPGVKAAGAFGLRPTTLVVPKVEKIRGLNLPGTPWATSACCGITLLFF